MASALHEPVHAEAHRTAAAAYAHWVGDPKVLAYAAIAVGILVRSAHVLAAGFPLNDGGLFLRMVQEIQAAHYRLPAFTSYNNASIPFAYSPLALYVVAALNSVFGIPLIQLFRFVPLIATILTVVAFYYLARAMLHDGRTTAAAVLTFALFPRSFIWLVMGGGVTRAPALFFAIIGLHQAYEMYTRREWRYAATTTIACALTVLTHLSTANFLAFSIVLLFVFYGRSRFGIVASVAVAAATTLLTAPWWAVVIAQHGLAPFHAAQQVSGSIFSDKLTRYDVLLRLARFNTGISGAALFPLVSVMAVVGVLASLRPGRIIFPIWWVVIIMLDARGGMTYAPIPAALLGGIAITDVLLPGLRSLYQRAPSRQIAGRATRGGPALHGYWSVWLARIVPALVVGFLFVYAIATALTHNEDYGGETWVLTALTPADRGAMQWVAQHTPPSSRFLVVSGRYWATDKAAEWFPVLANRTSVSTVQGTEWLPGFARRRDLNDKYQLQCGARGAGCLDAWSAAIGQPFTDVYVQKNAETLCCVQIIAALRRDPQFVPIYDGPAAFIAQRR